MAKNTESARDLILASTIELLGVEGLTGCSIDRVSRTAGCAKGLVNYHFRSKDRLLDTVAEMLRQHRWRARARALTSHSGTRALDALWNLVALEVKSGQARAWLALASTVRQGAVLAAAPGEASKMAQLASRALALDPDSVPPLLLLSVLEGLQLSLLSGTPAHGAREAFDRFWLSVLRGEFATA